MHVRWPYGWTAIDIDGQARLYNTSGITVAREGQTIAIGGSAEGDVWYMCGDLRVESSPSPAV